jgi:predicted DNA-binding transcriptional regulator AlpA
LNDTSTVAPVEQIDSFITPQEVARLASVTTKTVDNWISQGKIPTPGRTPSGRRRWRLSVIKAWLAGFERTEGRRP